MSDISIASAFLPFDVLEQIVGHLPVLSQIRAIRACRFFQHLFRSRLDTLDLFELEFHRELGNVGLRIGFDEAICMILKNHGQGVKKLQIVSIVDHKLVAYHKYLRWEYCPNLSHLRLCNYTNSYFKLTEEAGFSYLAALDGSVLLDLPKLRSVQAIVKVDTADLCSDVLCAMQRMTDVSYLQITGQFYKALAFLKTRLKRQPKSIKCLGGLVFDQLNHFNDLNRSFWTKTYPLPEYGVLVENRELLCGANLKSLVLHFDACLSRIYLILLTQFTQLTSLALSFDRSGSLSDFSFLGGFANLENLRITYHDTDFQLTKDHLCLLPETAPLCHLGLDYRYDDTVIKLVSDRGYPLKTLDLGSRLLDGPDQEHDANVHTAIVSLLNSCAGTLKKIRYNVWGRPVFDGISPTLLRRLKSVVLFGGATGNDYFPHLRHFVNGRRECIIASVENRDIPPMSRLEIAVSSQVAGGAEWDQLLREAADARCSVILLR